LKCVKCNGPDLTNIYTYLCMRNVSGFFVIFSLTLVILAFWYLYFVTLLWCLFCSQYLYPCFLTFYLFFAFCKLYIFNCRSGILCYWLLRRSKWQGMFVSRL